MLNCDCDGVFRWFATCFKAFDQELTFQKRSDQYVTTENKTCFKELVYADSAGNVHTLTTNSLIKWQPMTNGPYVYGKVVDFIVNQALVMGQVKASFFAFPFSAIIVFT